MELPDFDEQDPFGEFSSRRRPSAEEIDEQNGFLLRRQRLFRWTAQSIAIAVSELREIQRVAAFGAVAQPLEMEVPRFSQFRRYRIEVFHECADLDLAIWMDDLSQLKKVKRALSQGLHQVQDTPYGGVAHHQVDVHLFDSSSGDYRGRLCIYGQCPKAGKRECFTPGCGEQPFLQQFSTYRFNPGRFAGEPKVILFDRASGFLAPAPRIEGNRRVVNWRKDSDDH